MKKIFICLVTIVLTLFIFNKNINSLTNLNLQKQGTYKIYFDNLTSKKINEVFDGIYAVIIKVEVKTSVFTKTYNLNLTVNDNLEKNIKAKVLEDLIKNGYYELASYYNIKDFRILSVDLRCPVGTLEIIKERSRNV